MKKYLKYLGYGFLILISYYPINLAMAMLEMILHSSYRDEIHGVFDIVTHETVRDPSVAIKIFVLLCVLYLLILLGFFLVGRLFEFSNEEKMFCAFIMFMLPNFVFQIIINFFLLADDFISLLTWFFYSLEYVFMKVDGIGSSRLLGFLFTYLPFIAAFLGGVTKRKKRRRRAQQEKIADNSES